MKDYAAGRSGWRRRPTRCACTPAAKFRAGQRVPARHRGGRDRPRQHPPRPGPGGRGRRQRPAAGAGADLPGASAPRADPHTVLKSAASWRRRTRSCTWPGTRELAEVHVQLMGEVQLEILQKPPAGAVRAGRHLQRGRHSVQGDHHRSGRGHRPLRASAPLCRGPPAAGARPPGQRRAAGHRLPAGLAGRQLAAAGADPSGRAHPSRRADRCAPDRREDHPRCRPRPPQTHRGRGLPPGHLPGGAPGPADGRPKTRAAGALVRVHPGAARRLLGRAMATCSGCAAALSLPSPRATP